MDARTTMKGREREGVGFFSPVSGEGPDKVTPKYNALCGNPYTVLTEQGSRGRLPSGIATAHRVSKS